MFYSDRDLRGSYYFEDISFTTPKSVGGSSTPQTIAAIDGVQPRKADF
jgi:hypothetical protein